MYCNKCGCQIDNGAVACLLCGTQLEVSSIPSYLALAVISTVCCCLPTGIVAIVYANKVNTRIMRGDVAGAQEASKKARLWAWIGIIAFAVCSIVAVMIKLTLADVLLASRGAGSV